MYSAWKMHWKPGRKLSPLNEANVQSTAKSSSRNSEKARKKYKGKIICVNTTQRTSRHNNTLLWNDSGIFIYRLK